MRLRLQASPLWNSSRPPLLTILKDTKHMAVDDGVMEKMRVDLAKLLHVVGRGEEGRAMLEECFLISEKSKRKGTSQLSSPSCKSCNLIFLRSQLLNAPLEAVDPEIADIIKLEKARQWKGLEYNGKGSTKFWKANLLFFV